MFGAGSSARGGSGVGVVVDGVGFEDAAGFLFFELDLSASDNLGFALAIGGLGFFENVC
jgi:hypothetical protein